MARWKCIHCGENGNGEWKTTCFLCGKPREETTNTTITKAVRNARGKQSLLQFSKRIGLSASQLCRIEGGRQPGPKAIEALRRAGLDIEFATTVKVRTCRK